MHYLYKHITTALLIFGAYHFAAAQIDAWELTTSRDNLEVFTRKTEQSRIKEIRIKTQIKTSVDDLFQVLGDVSNYKEWVYKSINPKKLDHIDKNTFYYYNQSDFPFPFSNRDLVVLTKKWYNPAKQCWYSRSSALADYLPEESGVVRIREFESLWQITPLDNGYIDIDYIASADPGGKLPAWIINMGVTTGPVKTMLALKKKLEELEQRTAFTNKKIAN